MDDEVQVMEWLEGNPPDTAQVRNAAQFAPVREQLKSQPGRWAKLGNAKDKSEARSLVMKMRYEGFKFAFRRLGDDEFAVFGRYQPE